MLRPLMQSCTHKFSWISLLALCLITHVNATKVRAQRQPLVLAHGIQSTDSTWNLNKPLLERDFPVQVHKSTTIWTTSQRDQAAVLIASTFAGLPDSTVGVGHSNGGIVLRQAAMDGAPIALASDDWLAQFWSAGGGECTIRFNARNRTPGVHRHLLVHELFRAKRLRFRRLLHCGDDDFSSGCYRLRCHGEVPLESRI